MPTWVKIALMLLLLAVIAALCVLVFPEPPSRRWPWLGLREGTDEPPAYLIGQGRVPPDGYPTVEHELRGKKH
jgi:hypothetical protein